MGEIAPLFEDSDGNLVLTLSTDLLKQMGWAEETILEWTVEEDGIVFVKEKNSVT